MDRIPSTTAHTEQPPTHPRTQQNTFALKLANWKQSLNLPPLWTDLVLDKYLEKLNRPTIDEFSFSSDIVFNQWFHKMLSWSATDNASIIANALENRDFKTIVFSYSDITAIGLQKFAPALKEMKSLESLKFRHCQNLDDVALDVIADVIRDLPLKELYISHTPHVTFKGVATVANACQNKQSLKALTLACLGPKIPNTQPETYLIDNDLPLWNGFLGLMNTCPNLEVVNFRGNSQAQSYPSFKTDHTEFNLTHRQGVYSSKKIGKVAWTAGDLYASHVFG